MGGVVSGLVFWRCEVGIGCSFLLTGTGLGWGGEETQLGEAVLIPLKVELGFGKAVSGKGDVFGRDVTSDEVAVGALACHAGGA